MDFIETGSKQQKAFYRKLYLSHLIETEPHNLLSLHKLTQMPRRTLQDTIAALGDIGIACEFKQEGERHNAGFYRIASWGPINRAWVEAQISDIQKCLI